MSEQPENDAEVPRTKNAAFGIALGLVALVIAVVAWKGMTASAFDPTIGGTTQYPRPTSH